MKFLSNKPLFNKPLSIKSKVLTSAVALSMLGTAGIATANDSFSDKQADREARMAKKLDMTIEAASTKVSAERAVQIAQSQVSGSSVMGVHYGTGNKMGRRGGRNGKSGQTVDNTQANTETTPSYHVGLVDAEGKRYHVSIDATTGKVLSNEEMKRPEHSGRKDKKRGKRNGGEQTNQQRQNQQRLDMQKPAVSITQAMDAAESKLGGEAVGAKFGQKGKHKGRYGRHGHAGKGRMQAMQNSQGQQNTADKINERPAPSYHVQVVKSGQVYFAKVDGQTGQVTETKTLEEMKAEMQKKRTERQSRRGAGK